MLIWRSPGVSKGTTLVVPKKLNPHPGPQVKEHINWYRNRKEKAVETQAVCAGAALGEGFVYAGRVEQACQGQEGNEHGERGQGGQQPCSGHRAPVPPRPAAPQGCSEPEPGAFLRVFLAASGTMFGMPSMMGYAMPSSSLMSSFVASSYLARQVRVGGRNIRAKHEEQRLTWVCLGLGCSSPAPSSPQRPLGERAHQEAQQRWLRWLRPR